MTWRLDAACLGMDYEVFFGQGDTKLARETCRVCHVKTPCLEDALAHPWWEDYAGIRGGLGPDERRRIRKRRRQEYERTAASY